MIILFNMMIFPGLGLPQAPVCSKLFGFTYRTLLVWYYWHSFIDMVYSIHLK